MDSLSDKAFLEAFEACTIPKAEWTHRAHVRMAWLYLRAEGFDAALNRIRSGIQKYNLATGGKPTGYHETITQIYARLIHHALFTKRTRAMSWPEFAVDQAALLDRANPPSLKFYKEETLKSDEARARFIEPDVAPLPPKHDGAKSIELKIVPFTDDLAIHFREINEEWIAEMFVLEAKDQKVLNDPQAQIIDSGGHILFVEAGSLGIVGTGALLKTGEDEYELTKMGVLKSARGLKAGEFLLQALIEKAKAIRAKNLYLLTNKRCEAAIHLYEKRGFSHDPGTMSRFGGEYERCNVAMRFFGLA